MKAGELDKIQLMPYVFASLSEQLVKCITFVEKYSDLLVFVRQSSFNSVAR